MRLRFRESEIRRHAANYAFPRDEKDLLALGETVTRAGYLTKDQLRLIAKWKSPRSAPHVEKNSESFVREITGFALNCNDERARIESLTVLDGVRWPTASVVLHLFHKDPYPIVDFRSLWSIRTRVPVPYSFEFWTAYVRFCRTIAKSNRLTMRTLDQALWQFSKENQRAR